MWWQKNYIEAILAGYDTVILKDLKGWKIEVESKSDGIYIKSKFFRSADGNIVSVTKVDRTLYRTEYFYNENRKEETSIELDYDC